MEVGSNGSRVVFVVDDDPGMRRALRRLLTVLGYRVEVFATAEAFLEHPMGGEACCLLLDLHLPGASGVDLLATLRSRKRQVPIVVLTARGDAETAVTAMKAGATEFLVKPVDEARLAQALAECFADETARRGDREGLAELERRFASLTPREKETFFHIIAGKKNKHTARAMGITEKTVKVHRARVLTKMGARSLADLVRFGIELEPHHDP